MRFLIKTLAGEANFLEIVPCGITTGNVISVKSLVDGFPPL